ncbi:hypothetical protein PWG71_05455 [Nocardiopsis sp. N85]|uniref:hypothetical protein n=1 Tax=Nocardiopsis sp. N85 TaxID=3029400 RepID=UPI00237FA2A6|nr:hypothetical protein [Nocardiopsis sp. N85]MDE3720826.1 hypothetical protein [Nocardiopsis sp. N85]
MSDHVIGFLSGIGLTLLFSLLAWVFWRHFDRMQMRLMSRVLPVLGTDEEEYLKSRGHRFNKYWMVGFFVFLALVTLYSLVRLIGTLLG